MNLLGRLLLLSFAWAAAFAPARAEELPAPVKPPAPEIVPVDVEYLEDKSSELRDAARNLASSEDHLYQGAASLWGRIPHEDTAAIGPARLNGWDKPTIHTQEFQERREQEEHSIDGISSSVRKTILAADVPAPEIVDAYLYGESMDGSGLKKYDDGSLGDGVLGVYKYTKDSAIGIFLNQMMRNVQGWVGNEFAAATDLHENAHARDHAKGELDPVRVKYGETLAYKTEYLWLQMMDPNGQKLSWARATIGKFATGPMKGPKFVADYLEHLAMIKNYGSSGDYMGLVTALGYRDRAANPWANAERIGGHHDEDGHEHGEEGHANRMLTGADGGSARANVLPIQYAEVAQPTRRLFSAD